MSFLHVVLLVLVAVGSAMATYFALQAYSYMRRWSESEQKYTSLLLTLRRTGIFVTITRGHAGAPDRYCIEVDGRRPFTVENHQWRH